MKMIKFEVTGFSGIFSLLSPSFPGLFHYFSTLFHQILEMCLFCMTFESISSISVSISPLTYRMDRMNEWRKIDKLLAKVKMRKSQFSI